MSNATTAIETLRAMYVAVRGGAELDAAAYVEALIRAIADGHESHIITRAFEAFGYYTRLDCVGQYAGAGGRVVAVRDARGWRAAIAVASALNMPDLWSAAMTAHFGPLGTAASRCDANDVPTLETLAEFPRIGERMAEAAARFEGGARWYDRVNAGRPFNLSHVVEYRAPRTNAA